ncbi:hypothetical protein [Sporosarcina jiandibaonis]|uniref:hypothetical protein n=1 Tax=Sporosarcina jiandibaonis TaxID=2715535 RepID=UPI0015580B2D|nr:hypothetical protein [Sporosarcina jiandibaonis]
MKKLIVIILVLILIGLGMLFYFKSYYPALPIESVSKREVVKMGKASNDTIIKLTEENGYEWYISKMNQGNANEANDGK